MRAGNPERKREGPCLSSQCVFHSWVWVFLSPDVPLGSLGPYDKCTSFAHMSMLCPFEWVSAIILLTEDENTGTDMETRTTA